MLVQRGLGPAEFLPKGSDLTLLLLLGSVLEISELLLEGVRESSGLTLLHFLQLVHGDVGRDRTLLLLLVVSEL